MESPRIFLAVDNCFASKRWTKPSEWLQVIKEAGVGYVEASADNECDPLYTVPEYLTDWIAEIKEYSAKTGVKVANLYSGHGTYTTLGLGHPDRRIADHMLNGWLKKMWQMAEQLEAGMGFFCHAFADSILQCPVAYREAAENLYARLAELAAVRKDNQGYLGVEQMYTPHQIPWTIQGAETLLQKVYQLNGKAFYLTIDTGHQSGQRKFLRPGAGRLQELLAIYRNGERSDNMWLGPKTAYDLFYRAAVAPLSDEDSYLRKIEGEMDRYPYLFSGYDDGDPYAWLGKLGCYSPIIHLQQTTGKSSSHQPFTRECNQNGIISGDRVLKAIGTAYERTADQAMPPRVTAIYLTLEIFAGTADLNEDIRYRLNESVKYWRQFIPEDGLRLGELSQGV